MICIGDQSSAGIFGYQSAVYCYYHIGCLVTCWKMFVVAGPLCHTAITIHSRDACKACILPLFGISTVIGVSSSWATWTVLKWAFSISSRFCSRDTISWNIIVGFRSSDRLSRRTTNKHTSSETKYRINVVMKWMDDGASVVGEIYRWMLAAHEWWIDDGMVTRALHIFICSSVCRQKIGAHLWLLTWPMQASVVLYL